MCSSDLRVRGTEEGLVLRAFVGVEVLVSGVARDVHDGRRDLPGVADEPSGGDGIIDAVGSGLARNGPVQLRRLEPVPSSTTEVRASVTLAATFSSMAWVPSFFAS